MTDDVPVAELRRHLRTYVDRVYARGETFTVSRNGVPVAVVQPLEEATDDD
jgi:prevent-host-death family protein